jgi:hypothetical protein
MYPLAENASVFQVWHVMQVTRKEGRGAVCASSSVRFSPHTPDLANQALL